MARQVQHVQILSGQRVSTPGISLANVQDAAVYCSVLDANPTSTMNFRPEAAIVAPGVAPASAQYLPIAKADGSGMWALVTAGSFGVALGPHVRGFDQLRFSVSSVLAATASIMVIVRV